MQADPRIEKFCDAVRNLYDIKDLPVASKLVDDILSVRDDPAFHRALFYPSTPDNIVSNVTPFMAICHKNWGCALARRMVFETVDFGLEHWQGTGEAGSTTISEAKRAIITDPKIRFSWQWGNHVGFMIRWFNDANAFDTYQLLVDEIGFNPYTERDAYGNNVLHYAFTSFPRGSLDAWKALLSGLGHLPNEEAVALLRGDDSNHRLSPLAYVAMGLCFAWEGAMDRFQLLIDASADAGAINVACKSKRILNAEAGSGSNEFVSFCANHHPTVEAMRALAAAGVDIFSVNDANHCGLFVMASSSLGEGLRMPYHLLIATEFLGLQHPPAHSSNGGAADDAPAVASPERVEFIFKKSKEHYLHGQNAFLAAAASSQHLLVDLFLGAVPPADRARLYACRTTQGDNAVHLCLKHIRCSPFTSSGRTLFALIRHLSDTTELRHLVFEAKNDAGMTPIDLLLEEVLAKGGFDKQSENTLKNETVPELRFLIAVLGLCLSDSASSAGVIESPLFTKAAAGFGEKAELVVGASGVVSSQLRNLLISPAPLDRGYEFEKREKAALEMALLSFTGDRPQQRIIDKYYYVAKESGVVSAIPSRDYHREQFYKTIPIGYSNLLGANDAAIAVVASNTFAPSELAERATASELEPLDQTPFQHLLRRVAVYIAERSTDGSPTIAPDGAVVRAHIETVKVAREKAAKAQAKKKAEDKARTDRNATIVLTVIALGVSWWIANKLGLT